MRGSYLSNIKNNTILSELRSQYAIARKAEERKDDNGESAAMEYLKLAAISLMMLAESFYDDQSEQEGE